MSQVAKLTPSQALEKLSFSVSDLVRKEASLLGVAKQAQLNMASLVVEIDECDQLLTRKDEVLRYLGLLQQKAQAKNKGVFEEILTSLVHEVMPHKAGDKIVLSGTLRNNLAALDIDVLSDGFQRNVARDKGGSISNIVAMGLRFIVLARQPNRRVLFLDEADCHLREDYIPAFASVMQQLAHKLGVQVVYISHHPAALFEGYGRIIEIYRQNGQNHSQILSDEKTSDDHEYPENAFRYIRMRDFGPHENVLVELGGGLNIITGDNDLGKSKFITSISELLANDGQEARIRDDRPFFEVEVGLEMGMSLTWKYKRTGSQKTLMELKDAQGQVIETSNLGAGKVPDWLHTYLAMGLVNDVNIHVHDQDEPKYLLSSHYTSIDRAKMLPMGRESRDVLRMIQLFKQQIADANAKKRSLDAQLIKVKNLLQALSPLLDGVSNVDWEGDIQALRNQCKRTERLLSIGTSLGSVSNRKEALEQGLSDIQRRVAVPVDLSRAQEMGLLISKIDRTSAAIEALESIKSLKPAAESPVLRDTKAMLKIGKQIKQAQDLIAALSSLGEMPEAKKVTIKDHSVLATMIQKMEGLSVSIGSKERDLATCKRQAEVIGQQKNELIKAAGGKCPACQQVLIGAHSHV